jgi:glycosyltransferase involved in cell wall biosynthesis
MKAPNTPRYLLAIDLEPAPYKVDLWNAFARSGEWQIQVLYTNAKDVSKDAGHHYQELPKSLFEYQILPGHSILASINKSLVTVRAITSSRVDAVYISGYVNAAPLAAIFTCILLRKPFFVHSDIFNNQSPKPPLAIVKRQVRDGIRTLVFRYAKAVLVCGKLGYESAITAGCPKDSLIDFPYTIDRERLLIDEPFTIPSEVAGDIESGKVPIYFSGRMIARKGLDTLLEAVAHIERESSNLNLDWVLWVAGDGPLLEQYCAQAKLLGIEHRVRFLGFVQMRAHSWLLRHAAIIVVPSAADAWGIVVDEGMQLGKAVIASSGVGSAVDRIESGVDGLLFSPGNIKQLTDHLIHLLESADLRRTLGKNALHKSAPFCPARNVAQLMDVLSRDKKESS